MLLGGELPLGVTSITTAAFLYSWRDNGTHRFRGHEDAAGPLARVNATSFRLLAAWVV